MRTHKGAFVKAAHMRKTIPSPPPPPPPLPPPATKPERLETADLNGLESGQNYSSLKQI